MEAYKYLKSLSHDSIPMSKLDEQELDEYCQRLAIMDAKKEGQIEIAKNMLNDKVNDETIIKYTRLSIEEINELKV